MALTDTSGKGVCSQCLSSKGTEEDILMLQCSFCSCFIHTSCLRVEDPPFTTLAGDNFFDLVCSECSRSDDGFDIVKRGRMKVHVAILLALYNLHKNSPRPAQDSFYHWRDDIFSYINRHHHLFFPQEQSRIVPASFCATMTKFPQWIESGNSNPLIKGRGYYRLVSVKPPAVLFLKQTTGSVAMGGAAAHHRPSSKRGGTTSRPPVPRLRSPRTRQNLRDLAQAVEDAVLNNPDTSAAALSSPSGTAPVSSEAEQGELKRKTCSSEDPGGHSRSGRHSTQKQDNGRAYDQGSVAKRRREGSGSEGHRGGSSRSPRTRHSSKTALGNSSPVEGNLKWFDKISADPQLDNNLDMIFCDDFLAIANVEEVVVSSPSNWASVSDSPSNHTNASTSVDNKDLSRLGARASSEGDFKPDYDIHHESKGDCNILHGDALRNSLSTAQSKKMSPRNRGRGTNLLSPQKATDKPHQKPSEVDDFATDARGRPRASSSQSTEAPVPHKRHKLSLTFRQNKPPFVLDKQYKEDLQYVESLTPKNLHEEVQLLKKLDDHYRKVGPANFPLLLVPLRRKLTVRKEQRMLGIGVFNPHAEAKSLRERNRCLTSQERINLDNNNKYGVAGYHLLDMFLKAEEVEPERVWPPDTPFRERLLGTDIRNLKPFTSPYSGKLLHPYYLQLTEYTTPQRMHVIKEIHAHSNIARLSKEFRLNNPKEDSDNKAVVEAYIHDRMPDMHVAPLHFAPVRSEHIPQMNALARQCFWPGINLSDVLKYPEFTCVALYKFMVIGFGVAVPGAGLCGEEAYLSFLVVHPEWRRIRVAYTILYCLIEEIDTDITLHVSPSNHAMHVYQRFGFKSEEFIKNFYDKYLPEDSTESKHAFFMRRRRMVL